MLYKLYIKIVSEFKNVETISVTITTIILGLAQYSQAEIAMRRMLTFLMTDELDPYVNKEEKDDGVVVSMTNASLGWLKEPTPSEIEKEQKEKEEQKVADNDKNKKDTSTNPSTITDKKKSTKEPQSIANDDEELGNRLALKDSNDAGRGGKRAGDYEAVEISPDTVSAGLKSDSHNYDGVPTNEDQETVTPTDVALVEQEEEPTINRSEYTLESINFQIKKGQLVAIVGPVGCGKSSLLSAILGEMHMQAGEVQCHGSIAYCDQRPWILNATVKENVLFGMPYDERKFDVALYAANLEDDIKVLPGGVHTQIGKSYNNYE